MQCVSAHFENFSVNGRFVFSIPFTMPVKFLTEVGSSERGIFSPLATFLCTKKIIRVKKTGTTNHNQNIQNPKRRTCACYAFASLTGGLILLIGENTAQEIL
jgi:hypothetical protein